MNELRDSQKIKLFDKISDFVAKKIKWRVQFEDPSWTNSEISKVYGLPQNRQSELVGRLNGKYLDKRLSEKHFRILLGSKFMSLKELLAGDALTEEEKEYLRKTYYIHDDDDLRDIIFETIEAGDSPAKILRDHRKGQRDSE